MLFAKSYDWIRDPPASMALPLGPKNYDGNLFWTPKKELKSKKRRYRKISLTNCVDEHIAVFVKKHNFCHFANFNRLPKIGDNLDRPKSFRFVFRTISTTF
jgi:hypothetical protein